MTANLGNWTEKCILRKGTYYNLATEWHNMTGGCSPRTTLLIETNINGQLFPPRFPLESSPQQSAASLDPQHCQLELLPHILASFRIQTGTLAMGKTSFYDYCLYE